MYKETNGNHTANNVVSAGSIMGGDSAVMKVKKNITSKRVSVAKEKSSVGKLGPKTVAYIPDDIEVMYAAKNVLDLMQQQVKSENALGAFMREYPTISEEIRARLRDQANLFKDNFDIAKKHTTQLCEAHPLWASFKDIKGFTAYQMGIIMACVKNPAKFHTPSALMMYAGLGAYKGMPVNKLNLNKIKETYHSEGKEFKGFNTLLAGRMEVITDCLMRGKGWFYNFYLNKKDQKIQVAMNEKLKTLKYGDQITDSVGNPAGEFTEETAVWDAVARDFKGRIIATPTGTHCFVATKEARKESGNVMEVDKEYMWGKKNQSLISFADRAAKKAVKRILLHLVYTAWMEHKGLVARNPYPIEYLGHPTLIKLEHVVAYDRAVINKKPRKQKEEAVLEEA